MKALTVQQPWAWARDCLAEQRRLADRCTFLYGAARAAGCTESELRGHA